MESQSKHVSVCSRIAATNLFAQEAAADPFLMSLIEALGRAYRAEADLTYGHGRWEDDVWRLQVDVHYEWIQAVVRDAGASFVAQLLDAVREAAPDFDEEACQDLAALDAPWLRRDPG